MPSPLRPEHKEAFLKLKETIVNAPILKYDNPNEEVTVQCDSSDKGLGAALMQMGKSIAFASRALTQTEVFSIGLQHGKIPPEHIWQRQYRKVTVQSDHKPLETIARKPIECT